MAEARKVAEQKEKAARAAAAAQAPSPVDDVPKVTSWGLPHVGQKSSVPPPTAVPAPPVLAWSTPSVAKQPVKKTMKEIQEEEERRKKVHGTLSAAVGASDSAFAAATVRRAYVDTARSAEPVKVIWVLIQALKHWLIHHVRVIRPLLPVVVPGRLLVQEVNPYL